MSNLIQQYNLIPREVNKSMLEPASQSYLHQNNSFSLCLITSNFTGTKKDLQIHDCMLEDVSFKNVILNSQTIISNTVFTNVCFLQSKIEKILFYNCIFDDSCIFEDTIIDSIEVIDCNYPNHLFDSIPTFIPETKPIQDDSLNSLLRPLIKDETIENETLEIENSLHAHCIFNNVILQSNDAMKDADLIHCTFNDCTFKGCWSKSIFDNSTFINCTFEKGNMKNCSFVSSIFKNPTFTSWVMIKANLSLASIHLDEDVKQMIFQDTMFPSAPTALLQSTTEKVTQKKTDPMYEKYLELIKEITDNIEEKNKLTPEKIIDYAKSLDAIHLLSLISQLSNTINSSSQTEVPLEKEVEDESYEALY